MRDVRLLQAYKGFEETDFNYEPGSRNLGGEQMADNKKYYYLKLKEDFFDSDEMLLLQGMKDGYLYSDILMKMYLRSLKNEGRLMYKDYIPYSLEMISTITRHQVGIVERAMKIFEQLKLVEVLDNGAIYMMDIQNFIGQSSTEADRQRKYYRRIQDEKKLSGSQTPEALIPEMQEPEQEKPPVEKPPKSKKATAKKEDTMQLYERLVPDYALGGEIREKMCEWCTYKIERKEGYKEQGMKSLLRQVEKKVAEFGEGRVCDLIEECMSNNWKGIIWDKMTQIPQRPAGNRIQNRVSEVDNW